MFQPGDTVDGRYEISGNLGQGGMAHVFRARDQHLERDVALKVLRPHLTEIDGERFRREIRALASLKHPGIANIFDLGLGEFVYFAMELITGGPITNLGPLEDDVENLGTNLQAAITVAEALAYVHRRGMVHRDLTPRNILLTDQNQPKVMDFGLVQLTETSQQLTRTGFTLGTPQYMAPEQARGDLTGFATDLYAFGAVLYRTFTGSAPFEAENDQAILYQHVYSEAVPIQDLNPLLPDPLALLVMSLLAKEPSARPASGESIADTLRAIRSSALRRATHLPLGGSARKAVYPAGPPLPANLELKWRTHLPDGPQWPGGIGAAEGLILLGLRDDRACALHPANGSEVMSIPAPDEVTTAPVYAHGRLYLTSRDGSLQTLTWPAGTLIHDKPGAGATGILPYGRNLLVSSSHGTLDLLAPNSSTIWRYEAGAPATTPPGLHHNSITFHTHDGWLHCVDAKSGKGRFKVETGTLAATPSASDGTLLLAVRSGELHAFNLATREVTWSYDLPDQVFGSPAIWQGRAFVGSWGKRLHCLSLSTGDDLWTQDLPAPITASPVIANGTVYTATEGGKIHAHCARTGQPLWSDRAAHSPIQASPLLLNETLIVAALDGTVSAYS